MIPGRTDIENPQGDVAPSRAVELAEDEVAEPQVRALEILHSLVRVPGHRKKLARKITAAMRGHVTLPEATRNSLV